MAIIRNNKKYIIMSMIVFLCIIIFSASPAYAETFGTNINESEINALNKLLKIIYMIMSTVCGIGMIISVGAFAKTALKLGLSDSGKSRSEAYQDCLKCTVFTACLASAPTLYSIFLAIFI